MLLLALALLSLLVSGQADDIVPLPILVLVPYPDFRPDSGWSRGLELLPAARIAAGEINNRTDILPGYRIELIEASSDACGLSLTPKSISNFANFTFSASKAIAVTGLACSTVTAGVSPIAGRP